MRASKKENMSQETQEIREKENKFIETAANQISDLFLDEIPDSPLRSKKHQKEKLMLDVKNCLEEHFYKMERGAEYIFSKLIELAEHDLSINFGQIAEEIQRFETKTKIFQDDSESFAIELENNKSLKEIYGLSNQTMEAFYKGAAEIYREKRYQDAAEAFNVLAILDPDTYLFWFGLGNSAYFCYHYEEALTAYAMAICLKPTEPLNYIFSANCYEALHDYNNALHALEDALNIMHADQVKYTDTIRKITEHKKSIENHLK